MAYNEDAVNKNRSSAFEIHDLSSIKLLQPSPHTPGHALFSKRMALSKAGNEKATKEFSPLLRTVRKNQAKQKQNNENVLDSSRKSNRGILSYEEIEFSDSMESLANGSTRGMGAPRSKASFISAREKQPGKIAGDNRESIPLKKQEDQLEQYKNENFGLKMKLFFLLQRLEESTPESVRSLTTENIELHTSVSQLTALNNKLKTKCEELERNQSLIKENTKPADYDDSVINKLKDYEGEVEDLRMSSEALEEKLKDKEDEVEELQEQIRLLQVSKSNESDDSSDIQLVQDLQDELREVKKELRQMKEDALADNKVIEELREELEQRKEEETSDDQVIEELRDELRRAKEKQEDIENRLVDELREEIDELKEKLQGGKEEAGNQQVKRLKEEIEDLEYELRQAKQDQEELRSQLHERSVDVKEAQNLKTLQLQELEEKIVALEKTNDKLKTEHNTALLQAKRKSEESLFAREEELEEQLQSVKAENEQEQIQLQRTISELEAIQARQQTRGAEVQDLLDERDREISGLKLELRSVKMQLDKSDIEVVELTNCIEELRRIDKSPNKDSSIYRASKGLEEEVVKLRNELRRKQDEFDENKKEWDKERVKLENEVESMSVKIESMRLRLTQGDTLANDKRAKESKEMSVMQNSLQQLKNEVKEKTDAIVHLEEEISNIQKSIELKDRVIEALKINDRVSTSTSNDNAKSNVESRKLEDAEALNLSLVKKMEAMKKEFISQKQALVKSQAQSRNLEDELAILLDSQLKSTQKSKISSSIPSTSFLVSSSIVGDKGKSRQGFDVNKEETVTAAVSRENKVLREEVERLKQKEKEKEEELQKEKEKKSEFEKQQRVTKEDDDSNIAKFEKITVELRRRLREVKKESENTRQHIQMYEREVNKLRGQLDESEDKNGRLRQHLERVSVQSREQLAEALRSNNINGTNDISRAVDKERAQNYRQMKGLVEQMKYLRSKADREAGFREDLKFMKKFFLLKIGSYQACNRADIALLEEMGIYPDYSKLGITGGSNSRSGRSGDGSDGRVSLKGVAQMVLGAIKMRNRGRLYREQVAFKEQVKARLKH